MSNPLCIPLQYYLESDLIVGRMTSEFVSYFEDLYFAEDPKTKLEESMQQWDKYDVVHTRAGNSE